MIKLFQLSILILFIGCKDNADKTILKDPETLDKAFKLYSKIASMSDNVLSVLVGEIGISITLG